MPYYKDAAAQAAFEIIDELSAECKPLENGVSMKVEFNVYDNGPTLFYVWGQPPCLDDERFFTNRITTD